MNTVIHCIDINSLVQIPENPIQAISPFSFFSLKNLNSFFFPILVVKASCKLHISNQKNFFLFSCSTQKKAERKVRLISHQILYSEEKREHKNVTDILQFADAPANPFIPFLSSKPFFTPNQIALERKVDFVDTSYQFLSVFSVYVATIKSEKIFRFLFPSNPFSI
jgi:hypothetical protein